MRNVMRLMLWILWLMGLICRLIVLSVSVNSSVVSSIG